MDFSTGVVFIMLKDIAPSLERTEMFTLSHAIGFGTTMPYGITAEEVQKRLQTEIDSESKEYRAFLKQFSAQPA